MDQPPLPADSRMTHSSDLDTVVHPIPQRLTVRCCGLTHPGRVRSSNQDHFLIATLTKALQVQESSLPQPGVHYSNEKGHLFIVADGMGGHAGGEEASALAVNTIEDFTLNTLKWFFHLKGGEADVALSEFQAALARADARIFAEAARQPKLQGMGTTVTMAYSINADLFVVHVGDSRCYVLRDGALHRLTRDHTLVQELLSRGVLAPEEAAHHQLRHVITNVVGGPKLGVQVEIHKLHIAPKDVLLLCSDGLTEMVPDEDIAVALRQHADLGAACKHLVDLANERGGKDNITVVVARYEAADAARG